MKRRLGVNIDHIATLREARKIDYPDPLESIPILEKCHVDQITCHLREDRRHISDRDLHEIINKTKLPVNMEMASVDEMVAIALKEKPHTVTLVPEKREEVTTEGGLNVSKIFDSLKGIVPKLQDAGIRVSLFIDPDITDIELSCQLGVDAIELHTGTYCDSKDKVQKQEFIRLKEAARIAKENGLLVFAGHGLNRINLSPVCSIEEIEEYNIGHSIIARSIFLGLEGAVQEIQEILNQ